MEYSYIWMHLSDNLLFNVDSIIVLRSHIHVMGPVMPVVMLGMGPALEWHCMYSMYKKRVIFCLSRGTT